MCHVQLFFPLWQVFRGQCTYFTNDRSCLEDHWMWVAWSTIIHTSQPAALDCKESLRILNSYSSSSDAEDEISERRNGTKSGIYFVKTGSVEKGKAPLSAVCDYKFLKVWSELRREATMCNLEPDIRVWPDCGRCVHLIGSSDCPSANDAPVWCKAITHIWIPLAIYLYFHYLVLCHHIIIHYTYKGWEIKGRLS